MIARGSDAYRLWLAMWSRTDEGGVFRGDPRRLAAAVLGTRDVRAVANLLADLEHAQLVHPCPRQRWCGIRLRSDATAAGAPSVCPTHFEEEQFMNVSRSIASRQVRHA